MRINLELWWAAD